MLTNHPNLPARSGPGGTPVYEMRPAAREDLSAILDLVKARTHWMTTHGKDPLYARHAEITDMAGETSESGMPIVWLCEEDGQLVGVTSLLTSVQDKLWPAPSRDEPALLISETFTHPDVRRDKLGRIIAWWVLGYASTLNVEWVRRITYDTRLMEYYRDDQGWEVVASVPKVAGRRKYLMQRRAENLRNLDQLVSCVTPLCPSSGLGPAPVGPAAPRPAPPDEPELSAQCS